MTQPDCIRCGGRLPAGYDAKRPCPTCLFDPTIGVDSAPHVYTGSTPPPPPTPKELAPHFPELKIEEFIGQGGMGVVYRAYQPHLERHVALKVLRPDSSDPSFDERFLREARTLARLTHPNIVTVHDFGRAGGYPYLIMELVDGTNLRRLLGSGAVTSRHSLALVSQVCGALAFAHSKGVVHRDIKPENVLLDRAGNVKIVDFGLAKLASQGEQVPLTETRQRMGTPHYMAPEQIEHPGEVDHRADLYSLGVVLYELLTGELPLGRFSPPSRKVELDVRLDEVVLRSLAKEPEARYQAAADLRGDIERISRSEPARDRPRRDDRESHAVRREHSGKTWRWIRIALILLFVTCVPLTCVGTFLLTGSRAAPVPAEADRPPAVLDPSSTGR